MYILYSFAGAILMKRGEKILMASSELGHQNGCFARILRLAVLNLAWFLGAWIQSWIKSKHDLIQSAAWPQSRTKAKPIREVAQDALFLKLGEKQQDVD